MTFFEMRDVSFVYNRGKSAVLDRFSLQMEQGETVGILGQSGSGKSTLLRLISGLEAPSGGEIVIGGRTVASPRVFVGPERRGVGMVFQDYALFPHLTVERNIGFGLHRLSRKARLERTEAMLELVQMSEYRKRYPHELSGGQQQRVAFARAIAPQPALLLMDEPFSNLDAELRGDIRAHLKQLLQATGMTAILVTHDIEDANALCSRIIRLDRDETEARELAGLTIG